MCSRIKQIFIILLSILCTTVAQLNISFQTQLSNETWAFPLKAKAQITDYLSIHQNYVLTHTDHPREHYTWFKYSLGKKTFINEEGYFYYKKDKINLAMGRKYNPFGPGRMEGLFISPIAPSLDQITLEFYGLSNFQYRNTIIRLDNRITEWEGEEEIAQRWYYLRSFGYNYKDKVKINFVDAVIATGFNRGVEWYYVNPLSSLFMERKHQMQWREGGDSTAIGLGDNDNHFIGGNISVNINAWSLYSELLIDEWQLTHKFRDNMQTVFGLLLGGLYQIDNYYINIEYTLAGPWVYINRALYGSLEYHRLPIGLRSPNSQSLDLGLEIRTSKNKSISIQFHFEERGEQSFSTIWNAWDNYTDLFDFTQSLPLECKFSYVDVKGKYFNQIGIYQNWLGTEKTCFMIGKEWQFIL